MNVYIFNKKRNIDMWSGRRQRNKISIIIYYVWLLWSWKWNEDKVVGGMDWGVGSTIYLAWSDVQGHTAIPQEEACGDSTEMYPFKTLVLVLYNLLFI